MVFVLEDVLPAVAVAVTLAVLVYASFCDYRTREVSNRVWAVYAPVALVLSLVQFLVFDPGHVLYFGLSVGVTVGFAFLLFYSGAFGGADAKAFMCIALALPLYPAVVFTPLLAGGLSPVSQVIFPVTILTNSVLIAALSALYLFFRNVGGRVVGGRPLFEGSLAGESFGKKVLVLLTGQKFSVDVLRARWHVYPMEDVDLAVSPPRRQLSVVPRDEGRDEVVARLSRAVEEGKIGSEVWATPGLPMLIFVTVGLVVSLVLGDVVWLLVSHILG